MQYDVSKEDELWKLLKMLKFEWQSLEHVG